MDNSNNNTERNIVKGIDVMLEIYENEDELTPSLVFEYLLRYKSLEIFLDVYESEAFQIEGVNYTEINCFEDKKIYLTNKEHGLLCVDLKKYDYYDFDISLENECIQIYMEDENKSFVNLQLIFSLEYVLRSPNEYSKLVKTFNTKTESKDYMAIPDVSLKRKHNDDNNL